MLVKNCINFIIIGIALISLPILIYSIVNKKKIFKSTLILYAIYIVYLVMFLNMFSVLGIDLGLDGIFTNIGALVAIIVYILSIIICLVKIKKNKDIITKSKIILVINIVLIILPILFFSCNYLREFYLIKDSNLIIESNYQNGIIISEDFRYTISDDCCEEVTINIPKDENYKDIEYYTYYIDFIDGSDNYEIDTPSDIGKDNKEQKLSYLDKEVAGKILLDAKHNHSKSEKYYYNLPFDKDEVIINKADITYFKDTDYYLVTLGYDHNGNGGWSSINQMIYKGEEFISDISVVGDVVSAIYVEK